MELMLQVKLLLTIFLFANTIVLLGVVIGDHFGFARKATAIAVRVLNDNGSGSLAYVDSLFCMFLHGFVCRGVIAGINYAAQQHTKKKVPSVAKYVIILLHTYYRPY